MTLQVDSNSSGNITAGTITAGGNGYVIGDIVELTTSSVGTGKGTGAQFEIITIGNKDTLYLTNVQGENFMQNDVLTFFNSGTSVFAAVNGPISVTSNSQVTNDLYRGNVI